MASLHPHRGFAHGCSGLYVCTFRDHVKGIVYATCAALHRLVTLGTVLELTVRRAQSFVTEQTGYGILTSGWAAPHFSPISMGYIEDEVSCQNRANSPKGYVGVGVHQMKFSLCIREGFGNCEHVRDTVLVWASFRMLCGPCVYTDDCDLY